MVDVGFGLDLLCAGKKDYIETSLESKLSFEINSLSDNLQGIVEDLNNIADISVYDSRNIIKIKHTIEEYIKGLVNVYLGNKNKELYLWLDSIGIVNIEFGESLDTSVLTISTEIDDRCSKSELEKYIHFGKTYMDHGTYEKFGDVANRELILFVAIIDVIPIGVPTFYIPKGKL